MAAVVGLILLALQGTQEWPLLFCSAHSMQTFPHSLPNMVKFAEVWSYPVCLLRRKSVLSSADALVAIVYSAAVHWKEMRGMTDELSQN